MEPLLFVYNESGVLPDAAVAVLDFRSMTGASTGKLDFVLLLPAKENPLLFNVPNVVVLELLLLEFCATLTAFLSCICDCINWAPELFDNKIYCS